MEKVFMNTLIKARFTILLSAIYMLINDMLHQSLLSSIINDSHLIINGYEFFNQKIFTWITTSILILTAYGSISFVRIFFINLFTALPFYKLRVSFPQDYGNKNILTIRGAKKLAYAQNNNLALLDLTAKEKRNAKIKQLEYYCFIFLFASICSLIVAYNCGESTLYSILSLLNEPFSFAVVVIFYVFILKMALNDCGLFYPNRDLVDIHLYSLKKDIDVLKMSYKELDMKRTIAKISYY